jgi:hypothetical protein
LPNKNYKDKLFFVTNDNNLSLLLESLKLEGAITVNSTPTNGFFSTERESLKDWETVEDIYLDFLIRRAQKSFDTLQQETTLEELKNIALILEKV